MDNNSNAAVAAYSALQTRLQSDARTEHAATATRRDVHCASCFCCSRQRAPSQPHPAAHTPALRRLCSALLLLALVAGGHGCGPGRGIGGPRRNRRLTPLVFKQHVPNMSERNLGASALHEGAIRRDSPKFKDLVPNYNRDIIFKDEEGTGADRLMTQRCKEKLNTLAVSVMNQWPGVRLRVTESWDEDNLHGAESLHYEGRAVDITTSDRDRTKYGMLARLAVEAGFDWVYYESRAHIHCSVKSDSSHISHVSGCFSSNSTVLTSSGERKTMAALEVGDQVLSIGDNGETQFSEVILFMDRQLQLLQDFVEVHAEGGARLLLTPAHLMMLWNPAEQRTEYRFADQVRVGDFVFVSLGREPEQHFLQRVVKLRSVRARGVVAPLTRTGTIVVDSVAASCYAVVNSHRLAHWGLLPMRMMASLQTWLPTPKRARVPRSTKIQNGVHWYTGTLNALKSYVLPNSWRYH